MRKVAILGSTGSIGQNTLRVIEALGDEYAVTALGAGRSVSRLADQIARFKPSVVSVAGPPEADALARHLTTHGAGPLPEILHGIEGLVVVAAESGADTVVSAAVGALGFLPTYRALEKGLRVALANKETLVAAGELMTAAARRSGARAAPGRQRA